MDNLRSITSNMTVDATYNAIKAELDQGALNTGKMHRTFAVFLDLKSEHRRKLSTSSNVCSTSFSKVCLQLLTYSSHLLHLNGDHTLRDYSSHSSLKRRDGVKCCLFFSLLLLSCGSFTYVSKLRIQLSPPSSEFNWILALNRKTSAAIIVDPGRRFP